MDTTTSAIAKLIAEARERANKATHGPWDHKRYVSDDRRTSVEVDAARGGRSVALMTGDPEVRFDNASFIAHARTMIPALADTLEAVTKERDILIADKEFLHRRRGELVIERDRALAELQQVTERRDKLATQVGTLRYAMAYAAGVLTPLLAWYVCFGVVVK